MKFFIVLSLAIALFDAIPKKAFGIKSADLKPSTVGISHREVNQTTYEDVKSMVKESIINSLGPQGFRSIIFPGKTVLIKPNIVGLKRGVMTDIRVVRATAELAKEATGPAGKVYIAESLWGNDHYRLAGYDKNGDFIDDLTGVRLINLEKFKTSPVKVKNRFIWEEFNIPDIVIKADIFISVAVFKNHYSAGVTGALKNAVGIVKLNDYSSPALKETYRSKVHYRNGHEQEGYWLNETIVDLNLARTSDFSIIDGLTGLLNGPVTYGKMGDPEIIEPNFIISGKDAVAVDTVEILLMGYDPDSISYLKMAEQKGLGTSDTARININGISVDSIRKNLYKKYHGEIPKAPNLGKHRYPFPDEYSSVYPLRSQKAADPNIAMLYKDREPPQKVSFKNFPDNSLVTADKCIGFEAIDNSGLSKIEVYIDGKIYKILAKDEKQFCFDDASIKGGRHGVRLKAYDRYLNETYSIPIRFLYSTAYGSIKIPYVEGSANLDGSLDESIWRQAFHFYIEGENVNENPGWNPYNGKNIKKDDLSFGLYAFHDGKNLYFGFDVKDDDVSSDSVA